MLENGNLGVCQVDPSSRLVVRGAGNSDQTSALNIVNSVGTSLFFVRDDGNVGIGVTNPLQKLVVDGIICAKEVRVSLDGAPCWSDFVFNEDYKLMPLEKLEAEILKNKHLPGIPSSEEVIENGIELGEMQAKLLQKIEELTLYMIDLKKDNEKLQDELNKIKKLVVKN